MHFLLRSTHLYTTTETYSDLNKQLKGDKKVSVEENAVCLTAAANLWVIRKDEASAFYLAETAFIDD
jgi:hypothetical protein